VISFMGAPFGFFAGGKSDAGNSRRRGQASELVVHRVFQ
jgi:hypothetical protein